MKLATKLENLGLNRKEAQIYLAALESDETTIQEVAKRAKLKRASLYPIVENLISQGLIHRIVKGKKNKLVAADPKELEKIIQKRNAILKDTLPELEALSFKKGTAKPRVRFYEGEEGVKIFYDDTLREGKEIKTFSDVRKAYEILGPLADEYVRDRVKSKIPIRIIARDDFWGKNNQRRDQSSLRETRLIPKEDFPFEMEVNIYGNKVSFISYNKKNLVVVIIESGEITRSMESIFKLSWKYAGLVDKGKKHRISKLR